MKKGIGYLLIFIFTGSSVALSQTGVIKKEDFNRVVQQISSSLPVNWAVRTDTAYANEILIQSPVIDLMPDMTSNDPGWDVKGNCEIYILMLPRLSPDSINQVRKRNKKLLEKLPPQNSKNNLKKWQIQNEKTLRILDTEPTNYDDNYSYRIKCQRVPKGETEKKQYDHIRSELNRLFIKYSD